MDEKFNAPKAIVAAVCEALGVEADDLKRKRAEKAVNEVLVKVVRNIMDGVRQAQRYNEEG